MFLPLIETSSNGKRKFATVIKPLIPGPLFIETLPKFPSWNKINSTRSLSHAVTLDGTYRPVGSEIITSLQHKYNNEAF